MCGTGDQEGCRGGQTAKIDGAIGSRSRRAQRTGSRGANDFVERQDTQYSRGDRRLSGEGIGARKHDRPVTRFSEATGPHNRSAQGKIHRVRQIDCPVRRATQGETTVGAGPAGSGIEQCAARKNEIRGGARRRSKFARKATIGEGVDGKDAAAECRHPSVSVETREDLGARTGNNETAGTGNHSRVNGRIQHGGRGGLVNERPVAKLPLNVDTSRPDASVTL